MRLHDLIAGSGATVSGGDSTIMITGITSDSRAVKPGMLFAALPGSAVDGAKFVPAALAAGASAVLCSTASEVSATGSATVLRADEPRLALAKIAANFYPRQPKTIVAVTGTNGKTSIAEFTRQIWHHLGHKAASLGTIGIVKGDGAVYGSLTTPDPITLHRTLQELADEGITHLALEASSHGLDQFRLDGVRLSAGAFNNLGRDHLDYHPTVEDYLEAKLQLFKRLLQPGQPAIVNVPTSPLDATASLRAALAAQDRGLHVTIVGGVGADLKILHYTIDPFDFKVGLGLRCGTVEIDHVQLDMTGMYQGQNAAVAAALAISVGDDTKLVFGTLSRLSGVRGRLETAGRHNGGVVIVDYAHKPEALDAALETLREFARGKLICVFGCGGNRDKGKRPIMGAIATEKADVVIVTDDNPRNEDPAVVRGEILAAAPGAMNIGDRTAAIRKGVAMLGPGDVLLVAGKGHETGQIVGGVTLPFSDHDAITAAIKEAGA